jgi:two-component system response regulator GlrR
LKDKELKVLVVDDDPNARHLIDVFCTDEDYELVFAADGQEAIDTIRKGAINLVVTDIRMPGVGGEAVLDAVLKFDPEIPVIIMTSYGSIEDAVHFVKAGAYDYITKPLTKDAFCHRIQQAIERFRMSLEISRLKSSLQRAAAGGKVVGNSLAMSKVLEKTHAIAQTDASVVIYGESGTGKELIARQIHGSSRRATGPFIPVNCGALPETLLESELFGYKRGAFTGAHLDSLGLVVEANTGTLFLDEVGDITPNVQVKLLRFLQEKEIKPLGSSKTVRTDVRIISATNRDLQAAVNEGIFREDLFYRLNIVPIAIPPLRERKEDVPLLANYFLRKFSKEFEKDVREFSSLALQKLVGYHWPGNVRELENKIQQTVVMTTRAVLQPGDIDLPGGLDKFKEEKHKVVARFEYNYITNLLSVHDGNISRAAKAAGMDRKNFWQLMKKHGVSANDYSSRKREDSEEAAVNIPHPR